MYIELFSTHAKKAGVEVWAYCLMDNHVHFVAVPERMTSFAEGFGLAHKEYSRAINFREGWRGYLWQGRFFSVPLSERYMYAAIRYVERNPVRAGLVRRAEEYRWSSAKAHVHKLADPILSDSFLIAKIADWSEFLAMDDGAEKQMIVRHTLNGPTLGG